jgi:hypothetical protein
LQKEKVAGPQKHAVFKEKTGTQGFMATVSILRGKKGLIAIATGTFRFH